MKYRWMPFVAIVACLCSAGAMAQSVKMQSPVPYAEDNDISDAIKKECELPQRLADYIRTSSSVPVELVAGPVDTGAGRVLQLEIADAVSMGNAWLGHQKYTKVRGTLYQDGAKVAGFKGRRNSMGGAFAGYKGSCSVLDRTIEALGEDIGSWLATPVDGANLGD